MWACSVASAAMAPTTSRRRSDTLLRIILLLAVTRAQDNESCAAAPRPRLAGLQYVEFGDDGVADAGEGRTARLARDILLASEADALMAAVQGFTADDKHLDSTDGLPAYEVYVRQEGVDRHAAAAILPPLEARIGAFVADKYNCTTCYVCSLLLRRYRADERLQVKTHFDRMAFVTAVVSLNPADFDGGLFLQRTARADSRYFFSTGITDTEDACRRGVSHWYLPAAEAGSRDAQDALGELHQLGTQGYPRDVHAAITWMTRAAEQGHAPAQSRLGRLYLAGEGVPREAQRGLAWVRLAAEQGYAPAEHTMGLACQMGDAEGGLAAAASWFRAAAEAGVAAAQYELGVALVNGDGVEMNRAEGVEWLQRAAQQGKAEALADLETLARAGIIIMEGIEADDG